MQHVEGSGTHVLYIERTVFKGQKGGCIYLSLRKNRDRDWHMPSTIGADIP
jgi:hypothetical protein